MALLEDADGIAPLTYIEIDVRHWHLALALGRSYEFAPLLERRDIDVGAARLLDMDGVLVLGPTTSTALLRVAPGMRGLRSAYVDIAAGRIAGRPNSPDVTPFPAWELCLKRGDGHHQPPIVLARFSEMKAT